MAIQAQAPIVPVAISGGRAAMRKGSASIRPVTIAIRVGDPIETAGCRIEDRQLVIDRVRRAIESLRHEPPATSAVPAAGALGVP
jgi:1-acyl-sn-glycerol-3-phosphate acyltransferase